MLMTTDWQYVGDGRGAYSKVPGYNYVGQGTGAYTREVIVTPFGCRIRPCCFAIALAALLFPILWYMLSVIVYPPQSPSPLPTPPPVPPTIFPTPRPTLPPLGPVGTCTIWGDPHILTFDGMRSDYYSLGEYWIVKSPRVWIQGRYLPTHITNGLAVTKILAVGGPFISNHKLFVAAGWATWDGARVLEGFPSTFSVKDMVDIASDTHGKVLQKGREGKPLHVVHIRLADGSPEGLLIKVNRWTEASEGDYINVRITMHKQEGQDGHCGNFNGQAQDDDRLQVRARVGKQGVDQPDLLFHTKTPVVKANRPNINDCPAGKLDEAKTICKAAAKKQGQFVPAMDCLVDYCFGGEGFLQEG